MALAKFWHECDKEKTPNFDCSSPSFLPPNARSYAAIADDPLRFEDEDGKPAWMCSVLFMHSETEGALPIHFCPWCGVDLEAEHQAGGSWTEEKFVVSRQAARIENSL